MVLKVRGLMVGTDDPIVYVPMTQRAKDLQIQQKFGERLRSLRKKKGISQEALALTCGLDRTYIGGVERGERNISLINIHRLARALGVQPSKLMVDAESEQR